jgi:hypothetical protein
MENRRNTLLSKLYYSLDSPASFSGKEKLFKEAIRLDGRITRKNVDDWLRKQITYTLHRPVQLKFETRPVIVYDIDEQWQLDLVDLSKLSRYNAGYKHLLVCIDVLSKYAWIEPLKSKSANAIKEALQKVFLHRQPLMIQTDKGTEFLNVLVKNMLEEKKIKLFTTNSERKASVVERLNRTMKSIMFKYFTRKNTRKYIDVLPDLVKRYNNSFHRSIKMIPADVNRTNVPKAWINLYEKRSLFQTKSKRKLLTVGDLVRISIEKLPFQKRYEEVWTEEIFVVSHRFDDGNPMVYKLKDQSGEPIKGTFYYEELQKVVEPEAYRIEKIIRKKKTVSGKLLYYVKWKGYSENFNSYISGEDLKRL